MTPRNTTPEGFRTAAYLATKARLDAARSRTGKTARAVDCNPPNVKCGGRCIPPSWDCRLKGQGPDPHLRAVKTDPLGGLASIQRGATRIARGVTRGNISEVEGGKRAIIRGVVKATPGDLQRKQKLQATLENRTRLIGTGLAVVTVGLGTHALLMKSNTFGYRQGVGANINNAVRLGMSRILDATPIIGANRARVRRQVGAVIGAQLERQANPVSSVLTNQLARTQPSQADKDSRSALVANLAEVNKKFEAPETGESTKPGVGLSTFDRWDREHQRAFYNTTRKESGVGLSEDQRGNIFARPATNEFLARQFNLSGDDVLTTASIKDAVRTQLTDYKDSLLDLAQQQGFRVNNTRNGRIIDVADQRRFIQGVVGTALPKGQSNISVRRKLTEFVEDTLKRTPTGLTDKLYSDTYKGFNDFYTKQGVTISKVAEVSRMTKEMRESGAEQVLLDGRLARAQYLMQFTNKGAGKQIQGGAHAELVLRDYFANRVSTAPRRMYAITERLAVTAASELEGRPVSARDAFNVLEREGFTGAVPAVAARPARAARGAQAQVGDLARSLRESAQRRGETMSLEASYRAARAEIARRQRGDSLEHDLPPRVRAYLATRADLAERGGTGKPCGASHIPKAHTCTKGKSAVDKNEKKLYEKSATKAEKAYIEKRGMPKDTLSIIEAEMALEKKAAPQSGSKTRNRVAIAAAIGAGAALAAGGAIAYKNKEVVVPAISKRVIKSLSSAEIDAGINRIPKQFQKSVRGLVGDAKASAAYMALKSKGGEITSVNTKDNFTNWKMKDGSLLSTGSVGETLLIYSTKPQESIGGARTYSTQFRVDGEFDAKSEAASRNARGVASTVKKMFQEQVDQLPDNSIIYAIPYSNDTKGAKRRSVYEKYGFRPALSSDERLFAMKRGGKFMRMQDSHVEQIADLIRNDKADATP
jgi:hypothetical protein